MDPATWICEAPYSLTVIWVIYIGLTIYFEASDKYVPPDHWSVTRWGMRIQIQEYKQLSINMNISALCMHINLIYMAFFLYSRSVIILLIRIFHRDKKCLLAQNVFDLFFGWTKVIKNTSTMSFWLKTLNSNLKQYII